MFCNTCGRPPKKTGAKHLDDSRGASLDALPDKEAIQFMLGSRIAYDDVLEGFVGSL